MDTHVLLWAASDIDKLSPIQRRHLEDPGHTPVVSAASLWEITIKVNAGKLRFPLSLEQFFADLEFHGFEILPVKPSHLLNLASLPFWHRDPFDRLMIAQARAEAIPVLSQDGVFAKYDVQLIG